MIATQDINDPEFFTDPNSLFAKHGSPSEANTLSLGANLAFENGAAGVLALQAKPALPRRTRVVVWLAFPGQGQVADGDDPGAAGPFARVPVSVAEGVELLDIAKPETGLLGDPGPQTALQRPVAARIEGTGWQGCYPRVLARHSANRQDQGNLVGHRDDDRVQADPDGREIGSRIP